MSRLRIAAAALALTLALAACGAASAAPLWRFEGHEITAQIGTALLTREAHAEAQRILGRNDTLITAAPWADSIRNDPAYKWVLPLHFINTPDWACNYAPSDCPDDVCLVGAIHNYTRRLGSETGPQQVEALKFLIHFLGDIHEPLHAGFRSNFGGNSLSGTFFGEEANLHHIWDQNILRHRIATSFGGSQDAYGRFLVASVLPGGNFSAETAGWTQCEKPSPTAEPWLCPAEWASHSAALACDHAYVDDAGRVLENNYVLGQSYYEFNYRVVDAQLARGGVRTAFVLNRVLGAIAEQRRRR